MEIQRKWVALNKKYSLYAPSPEAVQAMYQLKEELEGLDSEQAARILTELYLHLHQYEKALEIFMSVMNRKNKADLKKQWSIQGMIDSPIRPSVIKPLIKAAKRKKSSDLPVFTYHQDPVRTQVFRSGFLKTCSCCGRQIDIWYAGPFYTALSYEAICPWCIANGSAASKLQGTFHDPACCAQLEEPKLDELLHRTPGYEAWQAATWLDHCDDYCVFIDFVGWKELVSRGIENDVNLMFMPILALYHEEEAKSRIRESMERDGSFRGYLFQCRHCKEYLLYADYD